MLTIRPETPEDVDSIRYVNEQAFGQKEEAELIERLRNRAALTLSLVAVQKDEIVGHTGYYPRFGFTPAKSKGIDCEFEVPEEAGRILELREGALAGRSGTVKFQPEFKSS